MLMASRSRGEPERKATRIEASRADSQIDDRSSLTARTRTFEPGK
jgi:hypothetical protein